MPGVSLPRLSAHQRGYDRAWKALRDLKLSQDPLCEWCLKLGYSQPAGVVDHIIPIQVEPVLRLVYDNLQSLCKLHHDASKQQQERNGYATDIGTDGWPIDPHHPVLKAAGRT